MSPKGFLEFIHIRDFFSRLWVCFASVSMPFVEPAKNSLPYTDFTAI